MTPRLRPATRSDADVMATTVAEGFEAYRSFAPEGWEPPDRLEFALGLASRLLQDDVATAIAEDGAVPAGHVVLIDAARSRFASDDPGLAHLEQLFVREAFWGSGVATDLLAWALEEAARRRTARRCWPTCASRSSITSGSRPPRPRPRRSSPRSRS